MARKRSKRRKITVIAVIAIVLMIIIPIVILFVDFDGDGLSNYQELSHGTGMFNSDTDGDGLNDGVEINIHKTNPVARDTDGDTLNDGIEINTYGTNPLNMDSDGDGLNDAIEIITYWTNPTLSDTDGDGLNDGLEVNGWFITVNGSAHHVSSDPRSSDSDGDQLSDWSEYDAYHTNPRSNDTDADGLPDAEEIDAGTNPTLSDTDNDGLFDYAELNNGTNPLLSDTDKDGIWDGYEVENMAQYGANPRRRDIFVEIDRMEDGGSEWWQQTRWLTESEKLELVNVFKNAPILNPDGTWGVDLHLVEHELVPYINVWNVDMYGNPSSTDGNKCHEAYRFYRDNYKSYGKGFYYCVLEFGGNYSYDFGFTVGDAYASNTSSISNTFMHELGHSLGLMPGVFDGIDSAKYTFAEYPSVMAPIVRPAGYLNYSSGGVFNDWAYLQEQGFKLHEYFYGY